MLDEPETFIEVCSSCGVPLASLADRAYPFGQDGILCMECALRRGGSYDEARDTWTAHPRIDDLVQRRPYA